MKRKFAVAAALAATLVGTAACGGNSGDSATTSANNTVDGKGKTIKVWLMVDAQSGWKSVVDDASKRFTDATGAQVQVEYQQWANVLTKLDASLAGSDVPDVVELGNTQFPKYVDSEGFAELDKKSFENSDTWLAGLSGACEKDGKTYCVPYYAGARVLIYRKDLFEKAGITDAPKTYDEFLADADKVQAANKDAKFGSVYMPGRYWYAAMSWVKANGGDIAKKDGDKWTGQLSTPASQAGLQKWVDLVKKYSKADVTKDEADQYLVFSQANAGMFYGNGWEQGSAEKVKKDPNDANSPLVPTKVDGKLAAAPMPEIPSLLGGSNVGVPLKSKNPELAAQWIKAFTDSTSMKGLIKAGALPNATSLLDQAAADNPALKFTAGAAKNSWAVPNSGKWADVEKANVLQNMLSDILTGKKSLADATAAADEQIAKTLNG
ncbi:N,N'-diacetylchitobiose transport system substrate-binding protein [Actinoplanes octamycinicus]|uniref:N,N'-diacetylchitobiose transport system substrate-binding protein n=1 Tax=Actinoplanes octamycinicus TaxID=135948 RepID=A0A7W7GXL7_9ACTN|nr:extracellular solute-binding protein [Actinoplanes octamycinicus]MBB4740002.1 N,N'-diacetylchitobiose transport system substrate-binding protein [Actinoplanes octamycinicus]GIE55187.1 sugar ABC transporter substrate-binding protein [Actinoplanes octamycinicus]